MPSTPIYTKCQHLGCQNTKSKLNGFCMEHGGKEATEREYDSIYQTPAWRSIRQRQMSIQPLCQACLCQGKVVAAKHIDHVFPWRHIGKHAFLHNIFQSLCPEHHSYKTGKEKHGIYLHFTAEGEVQLSDDDYTWHVRNHA